MDCYIGSIFQFSFNFAPKGWYVCHGQLYSITQYSAVYSLLGNKFGGDNKTTFALPDLRVKKADGSYYQYGEIMTNGLPYADSYMCMFGLYPPRG